MKQIKIFKEASDEEVNNWIRTSKKDVLSIKPVFNPQTGTRYTAVVYSVSLNER